MIYKWSNFFAKFHWCIVAQLKKKYGWESSTNTDLTQEMIFVKSLYILLIMGVETFELEGQRSKRPAYSLGRKA